MRCPFCGGNPVIYDAELLAHVCPHCGTVVSDRPIDDSFKGPTVRGEPRSTTSGHFTFAMHSKGVGETEPTTVEEAWRMREKPLLANALMELWKLHGVLFRDRCILEEAARLLHLAYESAKPWVKKSRGARLARRLARVAALIASRRCGNPLQADKLFPRHLVIREISLAMEKFPVLAEHYVPGTSSSAKHVVRAVLCIEKIPADKKGEVVEKAKKIVEVGGARGIAVRPVELAGAAVYLASLGFGVTYSDVVNCLGATRSVESIARRLKRALGLGTVPE